MGKEGWWCVTGWGEQLREKQMVSLKVWAGGSLSSLASQ
jgi:hypothetical protein